MCKNTKNKPKTSGLTYKYNFYEGKLLTKWAYLHNPDNYIVYKFNEVILKESHERVKVKIKFLGI